MKRETIGVFFIFFLATGAGAAQTAPPRSTPKAPAAATRKAPAKPSTAKAVPAKPALPTTPKEKLSYSLGLDLGQNFKQQEMDIDVKLLAKGIQDFLNGTKPLLSEKEVSDTMEAFRQTMMAKQQARMKVLAEQNKTEGDRFLAENKSQPGVVSLPSGLQYKELTAGTGAIPKATDTVTTHYRGTLVDGSEFDNSYKRGEPVSFPVTKVIPGWTEALQLMKVGSKWQLFVPANLGYGERSPGPEIPPNSTLIFEIELLGIK